MRGTGGCRAEKTTHFVGKGEVGVSRKPNLPFLLCVFCHTEHFCHFWSPNAWDFSPQEAVLCNASWVSCILTRLTLPPRHTYPTEPPAWGSTSRGCPFLLLQTPVTSPGACASYRSAGSQRFPEPPSQLPLICQSSSS